MLPVRLWHWRSIIVGLGITSVMLVSPITRAESSSSVTPPEAKPQPVLEFSSDHSRTLFYIMVAELYRQQGSLAEALAYYTQAMAQSSDSAVAEQAVSIALELGDNKQAMPLIEKWVKLNPDAQEVYESRAIVYARLGNYDRALDDIVRVRDALDKQGEQGFEHILSVLTLEAGPNASFEVLRRYGEKIDQSATVQLILANLAVSLDKQDEALEAAALAGKLGSADDKEQSAYIRSKVLIRQNKPKDALAALDPFIKTTQDNDFKLDYARILVILDRRSEALPLFKQLYEAQPEDDTLLYTLGLLYLEQKEYAFAEPLIKQLLTVPNRKHDANYFLGQIYEGQQRPEEAFKAYEQALPNSLFVNEALSRAANLVLTQKDLAGALSWLDEKVTALNMGSNQHADVLRIKAQLLQDAERVQEAIAVLNKADELRPRYADILYQRSLAYEKVGNIKAAEQDLQSILKDNPESASALNALGYLLTVNTNRFKEAQALIEKAAKLNPDDPAIMDSLGWVAFKLNQLDVAETKLRQAFELMPDAEVGSHLVQVLHARGKTAEAKQILEDLLIKYPNNKLLVEASKKVIGLK